MGKQGEKTYNQVCAYCHLGNGEGMKASLVNSKFVLGPETVLASIVLRGKVGKEMNMPPMEAQLNDEQIATVLTYIRQNWGDRASPVDVRDGQPGSTGHPRPRQAVDRRGTDKAFGKALKLSPAEAFSCQLSAMNCQRPFSR